MLRCNQLGIWMERQLSKYKRPAYTKWYNTAAWKRLRVAALKNSPICKFCEERGRVTEATIADHITPHRGKSELFFDIKNIHGLCKPCHDGVKQKMERGKVAPVDINGMGANWD